MHVGLRNLFRLSRLLYTADFLSGLLEMAGEALVGRVEQVLNALLLLLMKLLYRLRALARLLKPGSSLFTHIAAVAGGDLGWREHRLCLYPISACPTFLDFSLSSLLFLGIVQKRPVISPTLGFI